MNNSHPLPIIGITMGDPIGIGPEILVKALNVPRLHTLCKPLVIGDSHIIKAALKLLNIHSHINIITDPDQGLIPFKLLHFNDGVNTTLGLPIIRTSVDHGTAYDIAWQGIADPSSLIEAIKMAALQAGK